MSDRQALRDAVDLAVKNGWKKPSNVEWWDWDYVVERDEWWQVIFRHEFAQKLWGEDHEPSQWPAWAWHLQQMVLADNPLHYLGEHLPQ